MDFRLLVVSAPVLVAASWAAVRVLPVALKQFQAILVGSNA